jgi:hypothetical protein
MWEARNAYCNAAAAPRVDCGGNGSRSPGTRSTHRAHRSLLITANQPFGDWGKVFPDPAMTVAAIDRLVHHERRGREAARLAS